jgi:membrane fusion protein, multidrug efflux system
VSTNTINAQDKEVRIADSSLEVDLKPAASKTNKRQMAIVASAIAALCLTICGYFIWQYFATHEETDDAFVDVHSSAISSRVGGTVAAVYVDDNQVVKEGDLLARLDPSDYQVKADQSQAQVELAQHQVEQLQASVKQTSTSAQAQEVTANGEIGSSKAHLDAAEASISQSRASMEQAKMQVASMQARQYQASLDWERYKKLDKNGAVSHRELEQAKTTYDDADAQLEGAKDALKCAQLKVVQSKAEVAQALAGLKGSYGRATAATAAHQQTDVVDKQRQAALASLDQAQAKLKQDLLQLSYCEIRAPISGRVGKKNLEVGQHVEEGQSLLSIFAEHPWITANFKETQVGRMRPGLPAEVQIDSFPGVVFKGTIDSLAPASGAKYALLPPENATGNFTKITQRIPVKILLDSDTSSKYLVTIAPGMSCEVKVIFK